MEGAYTFRYLRTVTSISKCGIYRGIADADLQTSAAGGHHGEGITYAGLTMHKPNKWHVRGAEAFAGLMWLWIFYRAYHDGNTFLVSSRIDCRSPDCMFSTCAGGRQLLIAAVWAPAAL